MDVKLEIKQTKADPDQTAPKFDQGLLFAIPFASFGVITPW